MRVGVLLTFDFKVSTLKRYYSRTSPQGAYEKFSQYLIKNSFEKTKDSDYISWNLNKQGAVDVIAEFAKTNKWFPLCVEKISVTPTVSIWDISEQIKIAYTDEDWKAEQDEKWEKETSSKISAHNDDLNFVDIEINNSL